jgi:hypothetical protein
MGNHLSLSVPRRSTTITVPVVTQNVLSLSVAVTVSVRVAIGVAEAQAAAVPGDADAAVDGVTAVDAVADAVAPPAVGTAGGCAHPVTASALMTAADAENNILRMPFSFLCQFRLFLPI